MPVIKMHAKGQMTVPQPIRNALGIEKGTELFCRQTGPNVFECRVQPKPMGVDELLERCSSHGVAPTSEEIQAIVREGILAEASAEYGHLGEHSA